MLYVTSAEYVTEYKIRVGFTNGETGIVDLEDALWGPVFAPLKDLREFKKFRVSEVFRTICWSNNADLAPEFLYGKMVEHAHAVAPVAPRR